jgi:hypothetical protein
MQMADFELLERLTLSTVLASRTQASTFYDNEPWISGLSQSKELIYGSTTYQYNTIQYNPIQYIKKAGFISQT